MGWPEAFAKSVEALSTASMIGIIFWSISKLFHDSKKLKENTNESETEAENGRI